MDREGRWLVTASDDKTARVWSLADGQLEQVLRPPQGQGNEGKLFAVALSPSGTTIATGGWGTSICCDIYIFDRASGRLLQRLGGLPDTVLHLAFSPDGRYLAAALYGNNGLRVWRTDNWKLKLADTDYNESCIWVDFDALGRMMTTSFDGKLRLYSSSFRKLAEHDAPGGKHPYSAVFSPDGRNVALGYEDTTSVDVISAEDLHRINIPDTSGVDNGNLAFVGWSRSGRTLYAAGRYSNSDGVNLIRVWSEAGYGAWSEWPASNNTVMGVSPLPDDAVAYGTFDPVIGVLEASGTSRWHYTPATANLRAATLGRFHLSTNGSTLEFGLAYGGTNPVRFAIGDGLNEASRPLLSALSAPQTKTSKFKLRGWKTYTPTLNDRPLKLQKDELPHSLAISPGEQHFLLGTSWSLCYYDHKGNLLWRNDAPSTTFAVNIAANGKVAVAGFGDGTVRWYRLSDGQELLALFVHREDHRWVAWTPEGFYDASPGGEALFGYHLNQGPDREGVFVQVAQLREPFYRPDLIANRLSGNDAEIRQALARIGDVRQVLASGLPPELKWRDGLAEEVVSRPQQTLRVVAEDRGGGIGRAEFHLNGQLMQTAKGRYHEVQGPEGQRIFTLPVTLPDGDNQLEVILYNRDGQVASKPLVRRITLRDPNALPATLHVLAVGSDRYRGLMPDRVLDFAASDAARVADTLRRYGKGLFADTDVVTLLNPQAKLAGITKALEAMAKRVKPNDVFVLYLAGHAEGDGRNYYYLPWDFAHTGDGALQQHSLHSDRLAELLSHIPSSKRLLILDTCNAGNLLLAGLDTKYRSDLDASAIARLRNKAGRAILASTRSGMLALEGIDGSGAFTGVLLRGVGGAADRPKGREVQDGFVTVSELADYIGEELPRITLEKWHYEQIPMRQITGDSFPLTRVPAR